MTTVQQGTGGRPTAHATGRSLQRRPRANFETWSWFFMRVTGLILVFMALLHFAITHIIYDVVETDARFVAARWDNPLWRVYDWVLLALGLLHGVNGIRFIVEDYVRRPGRRAVAKGLLYSVTTALLLYGTLTIITFDGI